MPQPRLPSAPALAPASPAESLGKHIRWQVILTLVGILLLVSLVGFSTYNVSTVLIPDRGGVFREGVAGNPRYLSPLRCQGDNEVDQVLCEQLFRGLTRIDKRGRVVPDLAESWTVTDGTIYTFRLKPDQLWQDGRPVTVDDVLYTISVLQDPEVYSLPSLASLWRSVEAERVDDLTVRFILREPFTPFLDYTSMGLLPRHVWAGTPPAELATGSVTRIPVSNGPMQVAEIFADRIRLEPNPYYSGNSSYISALELWFYPDHPSLFSAFLAGDIDGISTILPSDLPAATARDDLQLFSSVMPEYVHIIFNLSNPNLPFFQDKLVRQALYYGVDRNRLLEEVVAGQGIVSHSLMLPENWAYNPNIPQYSYDPERAKQMLDQAGWVDSDGDGIRDKDGRQLEFQLTTNDDMTRQVLIERIALDWQAIGVHAVATQASFQELVSDLLVPRHFDAALIGWETPGDPDPYPLWHSSQTEGGGQNYTGWSNEEADAIMQEARSITDAEKRRELYWRFQEIFAEEVPAVLLYHPVYTYGVSTRVQNVQIGSLNEPAERFANFAEWYIVTRRVPANQVPALAPPTPPGGSN